MYAFVLFAYDDKIKKADDLNRTVDSCECVLADFAVQYVDVAVAPQEFYSFLPETTDQWKCCCIYIWIHTCSLVFKKNDELCLFVWFLTRASKKKKFSSQFESKIIKQQ